MPSWEYYSCSPGPISDQLTPVYTRFTSYRTTDYYVPTMFSLSFHVFSLNFSRYFHFSQACFMHCPSVYLVSSIKYKLLNYVIVFILILPKYRRFHLVIPSTHLTQPMSFSKGDRRNFPRLQRNAKYSFVHAYLKLHNALKIYLIILTLSSYVCVFLYI